MCESHLPAHPDPRTTSHRLGQARRWEQGGEPLGALPELSLAPHGRSYPIQTWKSLLVALNSSNHSTADLLLVLAADEERTREPTTGSTFNLPFRFTGDGLPALAGLLTSGIVEIAKHHSGVSAWGSSMPSFEIRITDKGRFLVEAWRSGRALSNGHEGSASG